MFELGGLCQSVQGFQLPLSPPLLYTPFFIPSHNSTVDKSTSNVGVVPKLSFILSVDEFQFGKQPG